MACNAEVTRSGHPNVSFGAESADLGAITPVCCFRKLPPRAGLRMRTVAPCRCVRGGFAPGRGCPRFLGPGRVSLNGRAALGRHNPLGVADRATRSVRRQLSGVAPRLLRFRFLSLRRLPRCPAADQMRRSAASGGRRGSTAFQLRYWKNKVRGKVRPPRRGPDSSAVTTTGSRRTGPPAARPAAPGAGGPRRGRTAGPCAPVLPRVSGRFLWARGAPVSVWHRRCHHRSLRQPGPTAVPGARLQTCT